MPGRVEHARRGPSRCGRGDVHSRRLQVEDPDRPVPSRACRRGRIRRRGHAENGMRAPPTSARMTPHGGARETRQVPVANPYADRARRHPRGAARGGRARWHHRLLGVRTRRMRRRTILRGARILRRALRPGAGRRAPAGHPRDLTGSARASERRAPSPGATHDLELYAALAARFAAAVSTRRRRPGALVRLDHRRQRRWPGAGDAVASSW